MNRLVILAFFFACSCSQPQSKIYPEEKFLKLKFNEKIPYKFEKLEGAISVYSRMTLARLMVKHVVNLSTLYQPEDNIRVDAFTPGLPKLIFSISRNNEIVQLASPEERIVYIGNSDSRPLEKVLGFPLPEVFLLNLLLGRIELPKNVELVEHSKFNIFRFEFRDSLSFKYRAYLKKVACTSEQEVQQYKFTGMEVLSDENEYLFFAKVEYPDSNLECLNLYPHSVEFENFNQRFSGKIDKIKVKTNIVFTEAEKNKIFYPDFPGYLVKSLFSEMK